MDADLPYEHHYSEPDGVDHMDAIYSADEQIGHMWNSKSFRAPSNPAGEHIFVIYNILMLDLFYIPGVSVKIRLCVSDFR